MPNANSPIEHFMSSVLVIAKPTDSIAQAANLMRLHGFRHLPIVDEGRAVGVLSQRDVYLIETLERVDPARVLIAEAMSTELYSVEPEEPLAKVVAYMAEHKLGSTLVQRHDKQLLGIFTTTDALRVLAVMLRHTVPIVPTEV